MNLVGRSVRIRLLPQAREALNDVTEVGDFADVVVVDEDQLGIWVSLPRLGTPNTVVLLRWAYFSTMVLEYEPQASVPRVPVGFR
jgi:hypothetical protein